MLTGTVILVAVMVTARLTGVIPALARSVFPLDFAFCLIFTGGIRASIRAILESRQGTKGKVGTPPRRVLIAGAGDAGAMVAREMQKNAHLGMHPIAFLDDDPAKVGHQIYGVTVVGRLDALNELASDLRIDEVVIALPKVGGAPVRLVVDQCAALNIPSRVMPGVFELLDGKVSVSRLRTVDIADLLRRPLIQAQANSPDYLQGATVLITGAGGSIGSELARQVAYARPARLVVVGHGENSIFDIVAELRQRFPTVNVEAVIADVRDRDRVLRVFRNASPDIVFHAAAHKHVPLMEDNAAEAVTNNIGGTRNVVDAAVAVGVECFVMVSTDKAAAPSNMMGASKRVAELIVQRAARKHGRAFVVVRFGNVLGSRGSVVPIFRGQIDRGGPVTVTHPEVRRYFMTIPEAVHLILQAGGIGQGSELFVLDMGEPVLLREMAADMIRLSGFEESEVPIVFTGLRPGEKLNEILWEDGASVEPTARGDIRRVFEASRCEDGPLDDYVKRLIEAAERDDHDRIAHLFRECIPSASVASKGKGPGGTTPTLVVKQPGA